jgi:glycosyltransferase involved in cell wall biosynthesis
VDQCAVWLHLGDHRDLLHDERFLLWLGPDCGEAFIAYHRDHPTLIPPDRTIRQPGWGPASSPVGADALQRLTTELNERLNGAIRAVREKLATRSTPDVYADRLRDRATRPLRILGITSRYTTFLQYAMRDLQHAATAAGHAFRLLIEEHDHAPCLPRHYLVEAIAGFLPDLIIIIDHHRKEFCRLNDLPIPFCNWIQDDLPNLFGPGCGENLHTYDFVVGQIGNYKARSSGYLRSQWHYVPAPVSLRTFRDEPVPEADRREYECDLSFATHRNTTPDELLRECRIVVPDTSRPLLDAHFEQISSDLAAGRMPASAPQTNGRLRTLAREIGLELSEQHADQIRRMFTDRLVNLLFREQVVQWASDMGLNVHVYGRGWDRHPTLSKHARGVAGHGEQLRCIYQSSRINVQAVATGAVHQRLMEGLASGGFFLIRQTPTDIVGPLNDAIQRRCIELGLRTEEELWNTDDPELAREVRALNEIMFAPSRLYDGYVDDLYIRQERGFSTQAGSLLPHYDQVSFHDRVSFEQRVTRFLDDEPARREIARGQRQVIVEQFSYEAVLERILDFGARYFSNLAASEVGTAREVAIS